MRMYARNDVNHEFVRSRRVASVSWSPPCFGKVLGGLESVTAWIWQLTLPIWALRASYFFPCPLKVKKMWQCRSFFFIKWIIMYINATGIECNEISILKVLFPFFFARATRHKPHRRRSCCYMKCSRMKIIMDGVESNAATKKLGGVVAPLTSRATTYNLTPLWWVLPVQHL